MKIVVVLLEPLAAATYVVQILVLVAGSSAARKDSLAVKIPVVRPVVEVLVVHTDILALGVSAVQIGIFVVTPAVRVDLLFLRMSVVVILLEWVVHMRYAYCGEPVKMCSTMCLLRVRKTRFKLLWHLLAIIYGERSIIILHENSPRLFLSIGNMISNRQQSLLMILRYHRFIYESRMFDNYIGLSISSGVRIVSVGPE